MLRPFDFYIKSRKVVKQNISNETVNSLMKKAKRRINYIKTQNITIENADFI